MSFCSFDTTAGMYDSTPIENIFLLEYLPTAPEGFLRVYLYMRMLALHPELGGDMDEVARTLHMDTDALFNAMTYWERQGLVRRLTDRPPTYAILPMMHGSVNVDPMENAYYEYRDFNANLQALFGADNLLHPKQYELANDWLNLYGMTQDGVLKLVETFISRSRSKKPDASRLFIKMNEAAAKLAERGAKTADEVERALETDGRVEKIAATLMKRFNMRRAATVDEIKLVNHWISDLGLTEDEIIAGCAETTKSRMPSMAYLNSILESRKSGGDELFEGLRAVLREQGATDAPAPDQMRIYGEWLQKGFEPETIRLAAAQCARKKKKAFDDLEWMIGKWAEMNLFRLADAEKFVQDMSRLTAEVRALLETCGSDRRPQLDDISAYERWLAVHSRELIHYAAQCAQGMKVPMRYIDKLLAEWAKSGVRTVEDARAQHESHAATAAAAKPAANPALNYEQRGSNEIDYSSRVIDLSQYYNEEDDQP